MAGRGTCPAEVRAGKRYACGSASVPAIVVPGARAMAPKKKTTPHARDGTGATEEQSKKKRVTQQDVLLCGQSTVCGSTESARTPVPVDELATVCVNCEKKPVKNLKSFVWLAL